MAFRSHLKNEVFSIPTIKEIANLAGVSRGTVDRVLNQRGYVSAETAQRVRQIAQSLNYTPNHFARALSTRKNKIKIGVILFQGAEFFDDVLKGIDSQSKKLNDAGCKLIVNSTCLPDVKSQIQAIDEMVRQNARGLIFPPINSSEIVDKINELHEIGIPVITTNSDVENSRRLCYVGGDYFVSGRTAGALMGMITGGTGNVGIITGIDSIKCHTDRIAGFREKLEKDFKNMHIVDIVENHGDEFISYNVTYNLLTKHPEVNGLYITASAVYGACRAVLDLNLKGKLKIICHDDVLNTKKMINNGVITATICQEPLKQGSLPIKLIFDYLAYGILPKTQMYYTDSIIKIKENLEGPIADE